MSHGPAIHATEDDRAVSYARGAWDVKNLQARQD
jgi:hypothetical protein